MKMMVTTLALLVATTTAFGSQISCNLKVVDTSEVGYVENPKEVIIKDRSLTEKIELNNKTTQLYFSLPGTEWRDYASFNLVVYVNKDGKIEEGSVGDEIKNIRVPLAVSSNGLEASLSYSHGGQLVAESVEALEIIAKCEIK